MEPWLIDPSMQCKNFLEAQALIGVNYSNSHASVLQSIENAVKVGWILEW